MRSLQPKKKISPNVLVIEDDESYAQALAFGLEKHKNYNVSIATNSFEAGNQMAGSSFDLIITDWLLPPFSGFSTLRKVDQDLALDPIAPSAWFDKQKTPVIVVTACDLEEISRGRKLQGRFQFLGAISKQQPVAGVMEQIHMLYRNYPMAAIA